MHNNPTTTEDPNSIGPLQNLSDLRTRMDSLQRFLSESINTNTLLTNHHMNTISNEIASAIHHLIINSAALLSAGAPPQTVTPTKQPTSDSNDCEIVELDAMELLAKHLHYCCEVCGKGFTRDANLRKHMRAHGEQFKTPEALAKKPREGTRLMATWFSCPFEGCNHNKVHKRFRPLKSVSCVRKHFKRTHCPKTHTCDRCRRKSFAVLSDLKSHVTQCKGEPTWKCSCGNTFSRKEKLLGHVALFQGHLPMDEEEEKRKRVNVKESEECFDDLPEGFFDDLDDFGFDSVLK